MEGGFRDDSPAPALADIYGDSSSDDEGPGEGGGPGPPPPGPQPSPSAVLGLGERQVRGGVQIGTPSPKIGPHLGGAPSGEEDLGGGPGTLVQPQPWPTSMGTGLATTRGQGRAAVLAPHLQVLNLHQHHEPPQGPGFPCRTNRRPQGSRPPTWDPRDLGLHPRSVRGPRVKGTQPCHQHLLHSLQGPLGAGHRSGGGLGGGPTGQPGGGGRGRPPLMGGGAGHQHPHHKVHAEEFPH